MIEYSNQEYVNEVENIVGGSWDFIETLYNAWSIETLNMEYLAENDIYFILCDNSLDNILSLDLIGYNRVNAAFIKKDGELCEGYGDEVIFDNTSNEYSYIKASFRNSELTLRLKEKGSEDFVVETYSFLNFDKIITNLDYSTGSKISNNINPNRLIVEEDTLRDLEFSPAYLCSNWVWELSDRDNWVLNLPTGWVDLEFQLVFYNAPSFYTGEGAPQILVHSKDSYSLYDSLGLNYDFSEKDSTLTIKKVNELIELTVNYSDGTSENKVLNLLSNYLTVQNRVSFINKESGVEFPNLSLNVLNPTFAQDLVSIRNLLAYNLKSKKVSVEDSDGIRTLAGKVLEAKDDKNPLVLSPYGNSSYPFLEQKVGLNDQIPFRFSITDNRGTSVTSSMYNNYGSNSVKSAAKLITYVMDRFGDVVEYKTDANSTAGHTSLSVPYTVENQGKYTLWCEVEESTYYQSVKSEKYNVNLVNYYHYQDGGTLGASSKAYSNLTYHPQRVFDGNSQAELTISTYSENDTVTSYSIKPTSTSKLGLIGIKLFETTDNISINYMGRCNYTNRKAQSFYSAFVNDFGLYIKNGDEVYKFGFKGDDDETASKTNSNIYAYSDIGTPEDKTCVNCQNNVTFGIDKIEGNLSFWVGEKTNKVRKNLDISNTNLEYGIFYKTGSLGSSYPFTSSSLLYFIYQLIATNYKEQ